MSSTAKKTVSERYWPHFLGLGIASTIYLRSRTDPGAVDVSIGLIGFVLILVGLSGLRNFNRKPKDGITDQVFERKVLSIEADDARTGETGLGAINRLSRRLRAAPFLYGIIALYVISAVFIFIRVPTTVGERWVWQLHEIEATPFSFEEVVLLPRYLVLHQVEVLFAALLILCVGYFHSDPIKAARRFVWNVVKQYGIALFGIAFILPILFVPCTYVVQSRYRTAFNRSFSEYRWLWQVGEADIKFGVLILEEVVVAIVALVIFLQCKRSTNS